MKTSIAKVKRPKESDEVINTHHKISSFARNMLLVILLLLLCGGVRETEERQREGRERERGGGERKTA